MMECHCSSLARLKMYPPVLVPVGLPVLNCLKANLGAPGMLEPGTLYHSGQI